MVLLPFDDMDLFSVNISLNLILFLNDMDILLILSVNNLNFMLI